LDNEHRLGPEFIKCNKVRAGRLKKSNKACLCRACSGRNSHKETFKDRSIYPYKLNTMKKLKATDLKIALADYFDAA